MSEDLTQTEQPTGVEGTDPSVPSAPAVADDSLQDSAQASTQDSSQDSGLDQASAGRVPQGAPAESAWAGEDLPVSETEPEPVDADPSATLAAERLVDLQRLQAEYINYKRRVERDRAVAGDQAVARVVESLLPVLDDIYLARQHGDLEGTPFASIAEKLDATLVKQGVQRYGQPGEAFDPAEHEALMRSDAELAVGTTVTTVVQVLQPGYRLGDRVLRPARVAVADPQ